MLALIHSGGGWRSEATTSFNKSVLRVRDLRDLRLCGVLTAFREVEDNLSAQNLLASQYDEEINALRAANRQLDIANERYRDGLVTYLEVATAESTALNVEFTATALRGQQLVAAVTLVKSLGGGWQENQK